MSFRAVIFDLDGTLLNTLRDLADSMNTVLERFGHTGHDVEKYRYFVGNGMDNLVRMTLPAEKRDDATVKVCSAAMREEYGRRWADTTCPYDGIPQLLDGLRQKGIKISVLSNKPDNFTRLIIDRYFPEYNFEVVLGQRPGVPKKPDPAAALEISRLLGIDPQQFIYLGDSDTDMKTANAAGMYAAGALWGFRTADELNGNGAKVLIEKPTDLLELLD